MLFALFYKYFPDVAMQETRVATVSNNSNLPNADYALIETYCNDPDCDCRRVMFHIESSRTKQAMAVISYGWEDRDFYEKWIGDSDPDTITQLRGPSLNLASPQSEYASALLNLTEHILKDRHYVERLKRHYDMFKQHIKNHPEEIDDEKTVPVRSQKIGRNKPCPCGSGKKYKKCCMGTLLA